jgi:hypothetical protein
MARLAQKILEKAESSAGKVLSRADLTVGDYDSSGRAVAKLVEERKLVRVGRGQYKLSGTGRVSSTASTEQALKKRVRRSSRNVFLRKDFGDLGTYDTVGRALRRLVDKGMLVQIGYGLYAKGQISPFSGKPAPVIGIGRLAKEALARLGKTVEPSTLTRAYNSGRSTQVPTGRTVKVQERVRRRIGYDGKFVNFERS